VVNPASAIASFKVAPDFKFLAIISAVSAAIPALVINYSFISSSLNSSKDSLEANQAIALALWLIIVAVAKVTP
jgi:hypothetical protein